ISAAGSGTTRSRGLRSTAPSRSTAVSGSPSSRPRTWIVMVCDIPKIGMSEFLVFALGKPARYPRISVGYITHTHAQEEVGLKEALVSALMIATASVCLPGPAGAQSIGDIFRKVNPAVVVIRAKGQDVEGAGGLTQFTEIGSGVLISADGKVMTAAHVVHSWNEINS